MRYKKFSDQNSNVNFTNLEMVLSIGDYRYISIIQIFLFFFIHFLFSTLLLETVINSGLVYTHIINTVVLLLISKYHKLWYFIYELVG